jgi:hypothetical protein
VALSPDRADVSRTSRFVAGGHKEAIIHLPDTASAVDASIGAACPRVML